ncbi:hypothetical protein F3087_09445 [Nocardia colli]|uniref:Uncharacterized protein n=1 Tax=Nocardia colli TaxID=2545717 RepID=A0A5N0EKC8_9NOCA|nr:hypothetical protein F3087_09445 [Nocardia colli]
MCQDRVLDSAWTTEAARAVECAGSYRGGSFSTSRSAARWRDKRISYDGQRRVDRDDARWRTMRRHHLLPAACCLLPAACCLLPAACCLLVRTVSSSSSTVTDNSVGIVMTRWRPFDAREGRNHCAPRSAHPRHLAHTQQLGCPE